MTREEQLFDAAIFLVPELKKQGSHTESDLSVLGSDPYKPLYRAIALLFAPTHGLCEEHLEGHSPTEAEAEVILRKAHPWFAHALDSERGRAQFEVTWEHMQEAWK